MNGTLEFPQYIGGVAPLAPEAALANGIRNPLAAIRMQMECLRSQMDELDPRRPSLDQTLEEVERISTTVEAILDHWTPAPLDLRHSDLGAAVAQATSACMAKAERRGVRVHREGMDRKVSLLTDTSVFANAVRRLFENAIDASKEGDEAQIFLDRKEGGIEITILDHGCGMSDEELRELGTPFATRRARGLGLGAHLALRDLRRLGASIEILSRPKQGTTVRIAIGKESA